MSLKDKMIKKAAEIEERRPQFTPLELTEGNVQAIFNRCLAKEDTPKEKETTGVLFSRTTGFSGKDVKIICFNRDKLLVNKKDIEYLLGQLKAVHDSNGNDVKLLIADITKRYDGTLWTGDTDSLFKLGYLGVVPEISLVNPVLAKDRSTVISGKITPTLSPKDPAFPAWWEAHKSEWEA